MSLAAGDLNVPILIEARTGAVDALNQLTDTWATHASVWSNYKAASGMGSIRAAEGLDTPITKCSFRIRYRTDITTAMRVNMGGTKFDIIDVRPDHGGKEHTDIVCEFGGNNG